MFRRFQNARLPKLETAKLKMASAAQVLPAEAVPDIVDDAVPPVTVTYPNRYDRIAREGGLKARLERFAVDRGKAFVGEVGGEQNAEGIG